jgi:hypothetical protein
MADEQGTATAAEPGMGMKLWRSVFRHNYPETDLDRMSTMVTNFFLHLLPAKVHPNSLRLTYTWALGMIAFFLTAILLVTGFLLMFFYIPSTDWAYHVLGGVLSPLDGIGPGDLAIASLVERCRGGDIREVVLAVNATVEGQTTAHYITDQLGHLGDEGREITVTRLAHGVPVGGELDYLDDGTLAQAMRARTKF